MEKQEILRRLAHAPQDIGRFVLSQLQGGAWSEIPREISPAQLTIYELPKGWEGTD